MKSSFPPHVSPMSSVIFAEALAWLKAWSGGPGEANDMGRSMEDQWEDTEYNGIYIYTLKIYIYIHIEDIYIYHC